MVINEKENIPTGGERAVFLIRVEWCHINQGNPHLHWNLADALQSVAKTA